MYRLSHTALVSLLPPEQALYVRRPLILRFILSASIVLPTLFFFFLSIFALISSSYNSFFFVNLLSLPGFFALIANFEDPRKPLLVIGSAGFFSSSCIDLSCYVTYRDHLVAWDELRGLILSDEASDSTPQLRFYLEHPDDARRLVEHRVDLSPILYGRGYAAARPIIDTICRQAGYTFILRRPDHPDLTAHPSDRVRPPWKVIFKSPPGAKRTWQF